jgi:hypothetical protein
MKFRILGTVFALALTSLACNAQAPAGSTGQCKDGSYTNAASKSGACRGHKGVQTWYATAGKAPASAKTVAAPAPSMKAAPATAAAKPAPAAMPMTAAPATTTRATAAKSAPAPAPNAGDVSSAKAQGLVWANLNTKVYHASTDKEYGTTKNGKFMTEAAAKAAGFKQAKR